MDPEKPQKNKNLFVTIIAGPTGVGKTTLSKMLSRHYDCVYIAEDEITKKIFPDVYKNIEDYPDKLKIIANQLFKRVKEIFDGGEYAVIDMINLEKEFIEEMQKTFHKHLVLKVLWSPIETIIERDRKRKDWTSGENIIKRFYRKYEELKPIIGENNYIDNNCQTPEETLKKFIVAIEHNDN